MPFVYRQNIDLKDLQLIGYDEISETSKSEQDKEKNQKTVHFFLDDYRFEEVWKEYDEPVEKLKQYKQVLGPDFSTYTQMPKIMQMFNVFRSRWCCSYWQQNCLAVIPTIKWSDEDSFEWCFEGIEKGCTIATATVGTYTVQNEFMVGYIEMCKRLEPKKIINYGKEYQGMNDFADIISIPYHHLHSDYHDNEYYEGLEFNEDF
jgi:hypothetical protein